ncbi:MAG: class I SAM-dependent methyltransferase [Prolixibacteraceae bacterium]|nr:class I SAM-dependent methyltransferase [Prolixibacteraceae bacterium]
MKNKVLLSKEMETLLIPLYGKAMASTKKRPILIDYKAREIVENIEYDFGALKIPAKTNTMMCMRAKLLDDFTMKFLEKKMDCAVFHLGCGLDGRYYRVNNPKVNWYDLDFPEVISIKEKFCPETNKYHLIASSVTNWKWIEEIPAHHPHNLVIAEGLLMYLREEEIKTVLLLLKEKLGSYTLIFDAFNTFTARKVNNHPSIKKTKATIHWGIDDASEITRWMPYVTFVDERFFTSNEVIQKMGWEIRWMYQLAHLFPLARNAQRILIYNIEKQ